MKKILTARARAAEAPRSHEILAPAVGRYTCAPGVGTYLSPGSPAGRLRILRRTHRLVVPAKVSGTVKEVLAPGLAADVEYGQPLLLLVPALDPVSGEAGEGGEGVRTDGDGVPEGMVAVRSPTDGIFYRGPSPDQPPYVEEGDEVARGAVLGLVEVMKCFNQIAYGSEPEDPGSAAVRRILVEDAGEVKLGQVLFLLEPRPPPGFARE